MVSISSVRSLSSVVLLSVFCTAFVLALPVAAQEISGEFTEIPPGGAAFTAGMTGEAQALGQYSGFYEAKAGIEEEGVTKLEAFDIRGQEPAEVYLGGSEQRLALTYSEFEATATSFEPNTLWIEGPGAWARYAMVPRGSSLSMIALSDSPGYGTLYEIYPSGRVDRSQRYFSPYNRISFYADTPGEHILLFVKENIASNAIVVDVTQAIPPSAPTAGRARVQIFSNWLTGYDVYVDGVYRLTEGDGGIEDGYSSITVSGDATHTITIRRGGYQFSGSRYFRSGYTYNLRLNPP